MKKFLLPLCLSVLGAMSLNAQGIIYAEEKFDWIQPFSEKFGLGDPVGTDNAETKGTNLEPAKNDQRIDGKNVMNIFWNDLGYRVRVWPNSAIYEIYAHKNYLRFGGNESGNGDHQAGLRWLAAGCPGLPEYPDELYLSFDWCPYKNEDGTYQEVTLHLETRTGDKTIQNTTEITHDLKDGEPMRWIHVEIDLYETLDYVDPNLMAATSYMIEPIADLQGKGKGLHSWYIDNLMLHTEKVPDAVEEISVDTSAPTEYYNLQGVRVAHPGQGLYIRRQGDKSKIIMFK